MGRYDVIVELTQLEPMTLVRALDCIESQGWLERRHDPADRRARRLYRKAEGKPLMDDIWRLAALTRREAFAGISRKHADRLIELLEKIQSNVASQEPLQPVPAAPSVHSGRVSTDAVRSRRDRTAGRRGKLGRLRLSTERMPPAAACAVPSLW
jgi:hypothetical protein